jgi:hypothetical protein
MNSKHVRVVAILAALSIAFTLAGCTSSQELADRADQLEASADRITQILTENPADSIEASELAASIVDALPESWQDEAADALAIVGDVRHGAQLTADKLREAAARFDEQAALQASETENTIFAGLTLADTLIGTNGLIAGIAGLFWGRKRKADARARDEAAILEDVVSSIEASGIMADAVSKGGGTELRASMSAETQKRVREIRNAINGN